MASRQVLLPLRIASMYLRFRKSMRADLWQFVGINSRSNRRKRFRAPARSRPSTATLKLLPLHLLLALLEDKEGIIVPVLQKVGVPTEQLCQVQPSARASCPKFPAAPRSRACPMRMQKVLDHAFKEAENFKDEYVSTEHLLLGLTQQKNDPRAAAAGLLWRHPRRHPAGADHRARIAARHRSEPRRQSSRRWKNTPRT